MRLNHVSFSLRSLARALCVSIVVLAVSGFTTSALALGALSIEEALNKLEDGQYFTVIGEVVRSKGERIYEIEDESGRMPVYVPENLTRDKGEIELNEKLQLWGKFDQKKLDDSVRGMRVSRFYRLGRDLGGRGAEVPASATTPVPIVVDEAAPAAMSEIGPENVIQPQATEDYKLRVTALLQSYRAAEANAVQAGQDYARAAREAGSNGEVDPEVLARLEAAEAKVVEIRRSMPELAAEGRAAGVGESTIKMIEMEAGLR